MSFEHIPVKSRFPSISEMDQWSILAALRFFLASVVTVNHLAAYADLGVFSFIPQLGAFEAILGFLLISGYSVSVSYLKEPEGFIWRRVKRLYPIYFSSIILTYLVHECGNMPDLLFLAKNALFLNQLLTSGSYVGPAWSLSLEFWLYCLAPTLMICQPRWNRRLAYLSFLAYAIYTACRTLFHFPGYSNLGFGLNLPFLAFIWICGLRLARERKSPLQVMWDIRLLFVGHILLRAGIQLGSRIKHHSVHEFFSHDIITQIVMPSVTLSLVYFAFLKFVLVSNATKKPSSILRYLGDVSYPLYLIHMPIFDLLTKTSLKSPIVYYGFAFLASAVLYSSVDLYSKRRHLGAVAA